MHFLFLYIIHCSSDGDFNTARCLCSQYFRDITWQRHLAATKTLYKVQQRISTVKQRISTVQQRISTVQQCISTVQQRIS